MASVREYAILYVRGTRTGGTTIVGGGNAVLATGQHALDGPEHTNLDAYIKATLGGQEGFVPLGTMGATQALDLTLGNYFYGTLGEDCTFSITGAETGFGLGFTVELDGAFAPTWPASVVTNDTDPETGTRVWVFISRDGGTTWLGFLAGSGDSITSPLTTKGDLWGYDTDDARVPVGANGTVLTADSTDAQGVVWAAIDVETAGHYELLMDGGSPPEPLEDGSGTDWLYVFVS